MPGVVRTFGLLLWITYPNWGNPTIKALGNGSEGGWKFVNDRYDELAKTEPSHSNVVKQMKKEGLINYFNYKLSDCQGFVKVQGNELNALLVLLALNDISKLLKNVVITLSDEGEFLLCPIKIKSGKCLPVIGDLKESIEYYCGKMLFSKGFEGNILGKLDYKKEDFTECFGADIGFENNYGDMTNYINKKLRNLKEIETKLVKLGVTDNMLYFYNINNRDYREWFDVLAFTTGKLYKRR